MLWLPEFLFSQSIFGHQIMKLTSGDAGDRSGLVNPSFVLHKDFTQITFFNLVNLPVALPLPGRGFPVKAVCR
jgi:hypothetical protein